MSYLHQSAPRAVVDGGRTGIAVIESSAARAAAQPRTRYRDPLLEASLRETTRVQPNIMFDPRVQRGTNAGKTAIIVNAAAAATAPEHAMGGTMARPTHAEAHAVPSASAAAAAGARARKAALLASGAIRPKQHSAAYIHAHITVTKKRVEVPTHLYLVEQKEATLVHTLSSQTDAMMAEAPAPAYVPRKTGVDTGTQVDTSMVFDFDTDVEAILEVVVSKSVEQALMEVREEEEMEAIALHQRQLHDKFASEEAQAEERLRHERALFEHKEKLLAAARQQHQQVVTIRSKLAAVHFSRHYLAHLTTHALSDLRREGFFAAHDSVAHRVEAEWMPHLTNATELTLAKVAASRQLVDQMVGETLGAMQGEKENFLREKAEREAREAAEARAREAEAAELARRQRRVQLFIHSASLPADSNPVGPINLTGESTVAELEERVFKWMEQNMADDADEEDGASGVPPRDRVKFLWNGAVLDRSAATQLVDLGIESLATLTMEVEPPTPKKSDENAEDGDEHGSGSGASDEEGEDEEEEDEEADEDDV